MYRLKRRWRDGTTAFVFEPEEFVARLAALVPPPRCHLVRYAGVLAPGAALRARIVPEPPEPARPLEPFGPAPDVALPSTLAGEPRAPAGRVAAPPTMRSPRWR